MKTPNNPEHIVECLTRSDLGGGQTVVFEIVKGLRWYWPEDRVSIVLPARGIYADRFRELGISVYELPFNRLSIITLIRTFIILKRIKPSIIHSHGKGAGFYTRIIPRFFVPAKRFHTYHGFHSPSVTVMALFYRILESALLRTTDKVIAISNSEANEVIRTFGRSNISCEVIENIVDCKALQQSADNVSIPVVEAFFSDNQKKFIVTMIARHDPVKNYPLALEACRMVLQHREGCAFLFVGIHPEDIQLNLVKQDFLQRIVGIDVQPSIATIISKSNAILLTSQKEGGRPLVLQEAFCFSKPVIATNVAGTNELVVHDFNGLLCDEKPDAVASAILRLVDDNEYYHKLCDGAASTKVKYDMNEYAGKYHALYSSS